MITRIGVAYSLLVIVLSTTVLGQRRRPPVEPGWVGLYSEAIIGWLENGNRISQLCPADPTKLWEAEPCRQKMLAPLLYSVRVYSGPTRTASGRGSILLVATPGRGLGFFHVLPGGGVAKEFEPDLNMQDWGYGPYFHQTYLDRRGDWFELPEDPFPAGTWFNAQDLGDPPHVELLDGFVEGPPGALVLLGVTRDLVRARHEQPADMWCEDGEPPALKPWTEIKIPTTDLYDRRGHLIVSPSHMKGC
jgi:hypothetical protein